MAMDKDPWKVDPIVNNDISATVEPAFDWSMYGDSASSARQSYKNNVTSREVNNQSPVSEQEFMSTYKPPSRTNSFINYQYDPNTGRRRRPSYDEGLRAQQAESTWWEAVNRTSRRLTPDDFQWLYDNRDVIRSAAGRTTGGDRPVGVLANMESGWYRGEWDPPDQTPEDHQRQREQDVLSSDRARRISVQNKTGSYPDKSTVPVGTVPPLMGDQPNPVLAANDRTPVSGQEPTYNPPPQGSNGGYDSTGVWRQDINNPKSLSWIGGYPYTGYNSQADVDDMRRKQYETQPAENPPAQKSNNNAHPKAPAPVTPPPATPPETTGYSYNPTPTFRYGQSFSDNPPTGTNPPSTEQPSGLMGTIEDYRKWADEFYNQGQNVGPDSYTVDAPETDITTREVGQNELAGFQLQKLLDPNSALSRRAIQSGKDFSASRGLMNSTIGGGNAYGAWVDRAQPFALDQAGAYQRTAGENMAAKNTGALQDSSSELQARLAELGYNAQRDTDLRGFNLNSATDLRRALLNIENREDTQGFQSGERTDTQAWQSRENAANREFTASESGAVRAFNASQNSFDRALTVAENALNRTFSSSERSAIESFQKGERVDSQNFTAGEREAVQAFQDAQIQIANDFQWQRDKLNADMTMAGIAQNDRSVWLQAWTNVQLGQFNSVGQAGAQIYANTSLTPTQQNSAVQNMVNFFGGIAPTMPPAPGPAPTTQPSVTSPVSQPPVMTPSVTTPPTTPIYTPPTTPGIPPMFPGFRPPRFNFGLM